MSESAASSTSRRNVAIAAGVVLFHIGALWALQTGLLRRAVEVIVPVQVFSEIITPPAPRIEPPQPQPQVKPRDPGPRPPAPPGRGGARAIRPGGPSLRARGSRHRLRPSCRLPPTSRRLRTLP